MSHTVIKFKTKKIGFDEYSKLYEYAGEAAYETIGGDDAKSWHAISISGDGESTYCGQVYADYERTEKQKDKGGITCVDCLNNINHAKSIKL